MHDKTKPTEKMLNKRSTQSDSKTLDLKRILHQKNCRCFTNLAEKKINGKSAPDIKPEPENI